MSISSIKSKYWPGTKRYLTNPEYAEFTGKTAAQAAQDKYYDRVVCVVARRGVKLIDIDATYERENPKSA